MPVRIKCPSCQASMSLPESMYGKAVRCPKCQSHFQCPSGPGAAAPAPAQRSSAPAASGGNPFGFDDSGGPAVTMDAEMKFAWIPPGHFLMGGNGQNGNPQHRVTITKGCWMGIFPVTQAQWQAVMGYNPSHFRGDDRPVEQVSWFDCQEFCQKMTELTGKPIRLPTEAEWEYACRAGTSSEYWNGNGEDALKKVGWYNGNAGSQTHPVGEKKAPNPWGLHDMHGNVWEWCADWNGGLDAENKSDPQGASKGGARVLRGGSWNGDAECCRAAYRYWFAPATRGIFYGFRVCFRLD